MMRPWTLLTLMTTKDLNRTHHFFHLSTIKHIHSVFFSRFRPSKTIAFKTSLVLIDQ